MAVEPARRESTYTPHLRLIASGLMGPAGTAWEVFSYSIAVGLPGTAGTLRVDAGTLNDMADDLVAFHARVGSLMTATARLTSVKIAQVQPDGSWFGTSPLLSRTVDVPGGIAEPVGGLMANAPQVALAVSLRTPLTTQRGRGRFYLPCPAARPLPTTGTLAAADATTVCTSVQTLVTALNNQPGIDGNAQRVVVASTFGGLQPVTSVQVGLVLDVIRSRRNGLRESYVTKPIAA